MKNTMRKSLVATGIAMAMGSPLANAALVTGLYDANCGAAGAGCDWYTDSANFTMLDGGGYSVGGTNNVDMLWDGNAYTSATDYTGPGSASNVTAASTTTFFGYNWTAHDIQVFTPGTYSFDATLGGGNPETGSSAATILTGQLGMHMLFDWNGNLNIDVWVVASPSSVFGPGTARSSSFNFTNFTFTCDGTPAGAALIQNCLYDGNDLGTAGKPAGSKVWMLAATDPDGDGIMGTPMAAGGPFGGFNANFMASMAPQAAAAVPVPAAAWLFGSGLMGLIGVARRKKA